LVGFSTPEITPSEETSKEVVVALLKGTGMERRGLPSEPNPWCLLKACRKRGI